MTSVLIIIFLCLLVFSLTQKKNQKKKTVKEKTTKPHMESVPHATNTLYDSTEINIVGIDDPVLNLNNTAHINDIKVSSFSSAEQEYNVSILRMTCSCPDFIKTRNNLKKNDPRRVCKHLAEQFAINNLLEQQDDLVKTILLSPTRGEFATFEAENGMIFCLCFETTGWVSVFTRRRRKGEKGFSFTGKYEQYGYSLQENRWSYGDAPPGSKYLKNAIHQTLPYLDKSPR